MTDGIIKSTGNSRYLKSVANFMALYPTYEDFAAAMSAVDSDGVPIDLNGINPDGWSQQGTPLNKANLLADNTCYALRLSKTATVNQALQRLAAGIGKYGFLIHLRLADGTPLPGVAISGLTSATGGLVVTDSNGDAFGTATTSPITVSVTSIWLDVGDIRKSIYGAANGLSEETLTMPQKAVNDVLQITSSQTVRFAKEHYATVCCVSGGHGGSSGFGYYSGQTDLRSGGAGGTGGKVINQNTTITSGNHTVTIGAGGAGGVGQVQVSTPGSLGGATQFDNITSDSGSTTTLPLNSSSYNIGGNGGEGGTSFASGNGGSGKSGIRAGGGGGGGRGSTGTHGVGGSSPGGSAGYSGTSSGGGRGGNGGPGGGGGGGGGCIPTNSSSAGAAGGKGGDGVVLIKLLS